MIQKLIELLSDKKRWTQGANARDANEFEVAPSSKLATCWCLAGAISKCTRNTGDFDSLVHLLNCEVSAKTNFHSIITFNDHSTHDQVLNLLKGIDA